MNVHSSLLGLYEPGPGWLFRLLVGWKYVLVLALTLPPIILGQWWLTAAVIVVVLGLLWSSGIGPTRALRIGWPLWVMLGAVLAYQLVTFNPTGAVTQPGNILIAVLAARLLTLTTSTPVLMDALARGLAPLRLVRVGPAQVALTIALMIRSIPYLLGSIDDARAAARARGRERNPVHLLTPVMLGAVAYAQRTGEALHARGLPGDD